MPLIPSLASSTLECNTLITVAAFTVYYSTSGAQLRNSTVTHVPAPSIAPFPGATPLDDTLGDHRIEDTLNDGAHEAHTMDTEVPKLSAHLPEQDVNSFPVLPDNPANSQPMQSLIIDHFPIGSADVLIAGAHDTSGTAMNEQSLGAQGSIWAPFHSQSNWEIALWAKMCGLISSVFTDLLAILEVSAPLCYLL
jgi:hypothetical protein